MNSVGATVERHLVVAVDRLDLELVGELDAGDGDGVLADAHHAANGRVERRERACRRGRRLRDGVDAQGRRADEAERALGADHQPREVISGRGLAGPRMRAQHLAAGVDHGQPQDVLAHRPVAHGRRAGRAGGDHPADRRVGAGIDGEEHALGAQPGIERPARHPGLDGDVEIIDRRPADRVHLAHVDGDPAAEGGDVALQRGSGAERDERQPVCGGDADDRGRLLEHCAARRPCPAAPPGETTRRARAGPGHRRRWRRGRRRAGR